MNTPDPVQLQLYLSAPRTCSYLTGRESRTLFPGPQIPMNPALYNVLADLGFRRSGSMVYRHECDACRACTPIRLPVDRFLPRRIQRRVWRKNRRLSIEMKPAGFDTEQFELYGKYLRHRHPDSDMASVSETQYRDFLVCDWCDTRFFEFRLDTELVAVAVTDMLPTGLSAVYTFFDPRWSAMSRVYMPYSGKSRKQKDAAFTGCIWVSGYRVLPRWLINPFSALCRPTGTRPGRN